MTTKPPTQTPFDDEISLLDIIQFFKVNFKKILFCIVMGGILGALYGKFAGPIYEGSIIISPAKVSGNLVIEPKVMLTKLGMNSFYSKEAFLACNPRFYKDKVIDYDMSEIVKTANSKDGAFIIMIMQASQKETIIDCLSSIENDIKSEQSQFSKPLIEMKKNEIKIIQNKLQNKLKIDEDYSRVLKDKNFTNIKPNETQFSTDLLFADIALKNTSEIYILIDRVQKLNEDLLQTKEAGKVLPINIQRKSFPSTELGLLLGFFLGGVLGLCISLFKNMKID
jgi:hypothetical protein